MVQPNDPRGSIWRKWDLHIHTPYSYHWRGQRISSFGPESDGQLQQLVNALNDAEPAAFGLMDYWTLDGWFGLKAYLQRHPKTLEKVVFPGLEIRLEAPTDYRLNTHFLFDNKLTDQELKDFLSTLRIGVIDRSPSPEAFAELARQYDDGKIREHGYRATDRRDAPKMTELGMKTAKITRHSWREARRMMGDRVLVIQPYDTNDGLQDLDWKRHPYDDTELMRAADFFETRNVLHIKLFMGAGHPSKPEITGEFRQALGGKWKPVLAGSDAHQLGEYGKYPGGKACWIKADLTFAGLQRCKVDPMGRVFVGETPPQLKHQQDNPTKYIDQLQIRKLAGSALGEKWFDSELLLNPGMISIIGNKGGGKSALADVIALAGNSHSPSFEFLNDRRFRKAGEDKATQFRAKLTWSDGEDSDVSLNDDPNRRLPERVRYLPQQYIEELCAEVGQEGRNTFEQELKKVIFSHVPQTMRLSKTTLDDLVTYRTEQIENLITSLRLRLTSLNKEIVALEHETSLENIATIDGQIELKQRELQALDSRKPSEVTKPSEVQPDAHKALMERALQIRTALAQQRARVESLTGDDARLNNALAAADRLHQRLENLRSEIRRSLDEAQDDAGVAGIPLQPLVTIAFNLQPIIEARAQIAARLKTVLGELEELNKQIEGEQRELGLIQEQVTEPERLYQSYLENLTDWEKQRRQILGSATDAGTLEFLLARKQYLQGHAKLRLQGASDDRWSLTEQLHQQVTAQLQVYRDLYQPVESAVETHTFLREKLKIQFNVLVDGLAFVESFTQLLNQARRGSFYGQAEGGQLARRMVEEADLKNWPDVRRFVERVLEALKTDLREGRGEAVPLESQLREGMSIAEIYDFLFGLPFLRARLTLQLGGKEVAELSPGERGILLLVFYLLLDREEIPLVIDQPEHNLDNTSVYSLLEPCIRRAKNMRQIVLVTHNPNVAIVCDAEQVIRAAIDKQTDYRVSYVSGAIENPELNLSAVNILEGSWPAFDTRDASYQRQP